MYYRELRKIINVMQGFCDIWDLPAPIERNKVEYLIGEVSTALKFKLPDDYVEFLKEYDIGWFCMKKSGSSFWVLDKPSGREMQQFLCAGDMIKHILFWAASRADT